MDNTCIHRNDCRLCGGTDLDLFLPLAPTPPADAYIKADERAVAQPTYPLDVYYCRSCHHVQLLDVVSPELLFGNYIYETKSSPGLIDHFARYAEDMRTQFDLQANTLAVDIGSNDGTLLRQFQNAGMRVAGVDAASEIAERATQNGIPTVGNFFGVEVAEQLTAQYGKAAIVTANNVYAHADDLAGITDGIRILLDDEGVFVFEVSYLPDLVENMVFDFIYHEHLSYHSVISLQTFLDAHGLTLFKAERVGTKGGSLRGYAKRSDASRPIQPSVSGLLSEERTAGYDSLAPLATFATRINAAKQKTHDCLSEFCASGHTVAGYGASATVTTLLYHFDLAPLLNCLIDDYPERQGRFSPGHHIPVLGSDALQERNISHVVILAWRFADLIAQKNADFITNGGTFIQPLPDFRLISDVR